MKAERKILRALIDLTWELEIIEAELGAEERVNAIKPIPYSSQYMRIKRKKEGYEEDYLKLLEGLAKAKGTLKG